MTYKIVYTVYGVLREMNQFLRECDMPCSEVVSEVMIEVNLDQPPTIDYCIKLGRELQKRSQNKDSGIDINRVILNRVEFPVGTEV